MRGKQQRSTLARAIDDQLAQQPSLYMCHHQRKLLAYKRKALHSSQSSQGKPWEKPSNSRKDHNQRLTPRLNTPTRTKWPEDQIDWSGDEERHQTASVASQVGLDLSDDPLAPTLCKPHLRTRHKLTTTPNPWIDLSDSGE